MEGPAELAAILRERGPTDAVGAASTFVRMLELAPDPSPDSLAALSAFTAAGGVGAVVETMLAHG